MWKPDISDAGSRLPQMRRRRLWFAVAAATVCLLGAVVFSVVFLPYIEFFAFFSLLRSNLVSLAVPPSIGIALALVLTPLLMWSIGTSLRTLWRGQWLRLSLALLFPASHFVGAFVLAQPPMGQLFNPATSEPYYRYFRDKQGTVNLRTRWWRIDPWTGERLQDLTPEAAVEWQKQSGQLPSNIRTDAVRWLGDFRMLLAREDRWQPEPVVGKQADPNPQGAQQPFDFRLGSCTMTGPVVGCDLTVVNASAEDRWLALAVGDYPPPARSQMFDEHGREYAAQYARLGSKAWVTSTPRHGAAVQVVSRIPTSAVIRFGNVSPDAHTIRVLRVAYYAGSATGDVAVRVEFHDAPLRHVSPGERAVTNGEPEHAEGPAELGQRVPDVVPVAARSEPPVPDEPMAVGYDETTALRALLVRKNGLLSVVESLKLTEDDETEYTAFVNEWATAMTRMIADLGQAGLAESEWQAFVVKLTAQADEMSKVLKMPRRIVVYRPRNPQE